MSGDDPVYSDVVGGLGFGVLGDADDGLIIGGAGFSSFNCAAIFRNPSKPLQYRSAFSASASECWYTVI